MLKLCKQVRYRDGVVATYTGEKVCNWFMYLIVILRSIEKILICSFAHLLITVFAVQVIVLKDPKADYDGGSRGTIKTKGKRGPGFIKT